MVGIYALAPISGANFNPAVSVALALSDKLTWKDCIMYVVAQLLAGFAGLLSCSTPKFPSRQMAPIRGGLIASRDRLTARGK